MKKRRQELEAKIQAEFVSLMRYYQREYPLLELLYSVPNEAKRNYTTASKLKSTGMKSGVCDMVLPIPNGEYASLYIEFKTDKGVVSENQKHYMKLLRLANNRAEVSRSAKHALALVAEHTGYNRMVYFNILRGY